MDVDSADSEASPLWQMVPPGDYRLPAVSTPAALRRKWKLLARLFLDGASDDTQADIETDLRALSPARLDRLVPPIDWSAAANAFDQDHTARGGAGLQKGVTVVLGQPHGGHAEILTHWARQRSARLIAPPSATEILASGADWLAQCQDGGQGLWALPALERCYLRHANGLALLRGFLDLAFSGKIGPGVIGCDSWAWAYIQRLCAIPSTRVLTLQAFDGAALVELLLQPHADPPNVVRFFSAHTGACLLPEPEATHSNGAPPVSAELRQIAAYCRGNVGVAWHCWRERLRTTPDPQVLEASSETHPEPPQKNAVWVSPDMDLPTPATDAGEDTALLLHTLLLHNGLPAEVLAALLPIAPARLHLQVLQLEATGLVEMCAARWQVSALAYPGVRDFLRARGYHTDDF